MLCCDRLFRGDRGAGRCVSLGAAPEECLGTLGTSPSRDESASAVLIHAMCLVHAVRCFLCAPVRRECDAVGDAVLVGPCRRVYIVATGLLTACGRFVGHDR